MTRIRTFTALFLLSFAFAAGAQTVAPTPAQLAAQQVLALAPQLAAFAGSPANLQALAAGLVLGQPLVMTATTPDGITQVVTLNPPAGMTPQVAAQVLEQTRQALIVRGIALPTPEQIGVALTGGTLATPVGNALVPGTLTGTINPAAMQVQRQVSGLAGTPGVNPTVQALLNGLTTGAPITLTGTSANGAPLSATFRAPGGPMSAFEASQALQFANQLLASQGIVNPTPQQIQAALLGGTVAGAGGPVAVRGVLEGRGTVQTAISGFGTSFSPFFHTSASPFVGTSNSPTIVPGGAAVGPGAGSRNGAPSIAVQMQGRR
ncbi:MAG TPA: hypothetical protein VEB41_11235 [Burkholderiales bacterium]|nr:hypothetical protein [Burkholderiales bacterium]